MMIVDLIGCTHGHYPELEGGDLLIVTGDLTARDTSDEHLRFLQWIESQKYRKKIYISGNHDNLLQNLYPEKEVLCRENNGVTYLCDSGTEFEGLKIWGSPWTSTFEGMNPHCMAFTCDTEEDLESKWALIPDDIDILITHGPPYGILDGIPNEYDGTMFYVGSSSLREHVMARIKPKLNVFSHIHECGGKLVDTVVTKFVNCSHVNENYKPVNKPVRVVL